MDDNEQRRCSCECGCFTMILEIIGFILICNMIGCDWAERCTEDMIRHCRQVWADATPKQTDAKPSDFR